MLCADSTGVGRIYANRLLDLSRNPIRIGRRQVDLVDDRQHFETLVDRRIAVRYALCLDALRGIDDQQRAFAGRQRAGHLVREIDVAGRVDEIELVALPVARLVDQTHALGLDRDTALPLELHRVEHLLSHLAIAETATTLD